MGKLALFCVAVSVLCSVLNSGNFPVDWKFDPKKLSGKWYPLLTYSSTKTQTFYALKTKPLRGGGFSAVFEIPKNGTCQELKYNFKPISPGSFQTEDGKGRFDILMANYTKVLFCVYESASEFNFQLLGKKIEIPPTMKQKFQNFAKRFGLNSGEMKNISHAALCTPPPKRK